MMGWRMTIWRSSSAKRSDGFAIAMTSWLFQRSITSPRYRRATSSGSSAPRIASGGFAAQVDERHAHVVGEHARELEAARSRPSRRGSRRPDDRSCAARSSAASSCSFVIRPRSIIVVPMRPKRPARSGCLHGLSSTGAGSGTGAAVGAIATGSGSGAAHTGGARRRRRARVRARARARSPGRGLGGEGRFGLGLGRHGRRRPRRHCRFGLGLGHRHDLEGEAGSGSVRVRARARLRSPRAEPRTPPPVRDRFRAPARLRAPPPASRARATGARARSPRVPGARPHAAVRRTRTAGEPAVSRRAPAPLGRGLRLDFCDSATGRGRGRGSESAAVATVTRLSSWSSTRSARMAVSVASGLERGAVGGIDGDGGHLRGAGGARPGAAHARAGAPLVPVGTCRARLPRVGIDRRLCSSRRGETACPRRRQGTCHLRRRPRAGARPRPDRFRGCGRPGSLRAAPEPARPRTSRPDPPA